MLRKATGLPPTLTEAEVHSLTNKEINQSESEPVELFQLAAFSYLESDGHASTIYFKRALATGKLSPAQARYAEISIDRLENPQNYDGSLGVMVIDLTDGGNFEQSGLKVGDVIVSFQKEVVNEPMDIASSLAKVERTQVPLSIIRDGQKQIINVQGQQPAGVKLSQLIILNAIQL
jgi:S1-C subfamily serine protease